MSLRGRLAATIAFATVAILIVGGLLSHRHALEKISVEMDAAHRVALNAISRLIAELPASAHPQRDLDSLVRTFNGDRHVRLLLIDAFGQVRLESHLAPPRLPAPAAFEAVLAPSREGDVLALPGNAAPLVAVMLVVVPVNEIAEVWSDLLLNLSILGLFVALAFGLVFSVVGRSLMPLGALVSAFHRIGKGDYAVVLAPRGPPELAALARGCNEMAARLAEMAQRNRRLSEQLMRLQDEERAELARDLHDDVGPFLFAIDVDATSIAGILEGSEHEDTHKSAIGERAASIRQAARHARLEVRRILGTLRPGLLPGIGLRATIEHLVAQSEARHPDIRFRLDVSEEEFGSATEALLHRIVREAMNNALRHSHPSTVSVLIRADAETVFFRIADDGGGWRAGRPSGGGTPGGGYGLIGMRERVEAASGRLDVTEVGLPTGICVSGEVPRHGANEAGGGRAGPLSLPFRDPEDGSAARAERTAAVPQEGRASVEAA